MRKVSIKSLSWIAVVLLAAPGVSGWATDPVSPEEDLFSLCVAGQVEEARIGFRHLIEERSADIEKILAEPSGSEFRTTQTAWEIAALSQTVVIWETAEILLQHRGRVTPLQFYTEVGDTITQIDRQMERLAAQRGEKAWSKRDNELDFERAQASLQKNILKTIAFLRNGAAPEKRQDILRRAAGRGGVPKTLEEFDAKNPDLLKLFNIVLEPSGSVQAGIGREDDRQQLRHSMDIIGIDPTALIRSMFPDATESSEKPRAVYGAVARRFLTSGGTLELRYAIYPDRSLAKGVLSRTMPQLVTSWFQDDYSEGFVSSSATHVRIDNMVLFLFPGIGEKPVCSPADALVRLREAVEQGHGIRRGEKVDTPAVKVLGVSGKGASLLGGRAKVLVEVLGGGLEELLLAEAGVEKRSCEGKDCVEITIERGGLDSEPMLRLVRPTGEALEIPLSQLTVSGAGTSIKRLPVQGFVLLLTLHGGLISGSHEKVAGVMASTAPSTPYHVLEERVAREGVAAVREVYRRDVMAILTSLKPIPEQPSLRESFQRTMKVSWLFEYLESWALVEARGIRLRKTGHEDVARLAVSPMTDIAEMVMKLGTVELQRTERLRGEASPDDLNKLGLTGSLETSVATNRDAMLRQLALLAKLAGERGQLERVFRIAPSKIDSCATAGEFLKYPHDFDSLVGLPKVRQKAGAGDGSVQTRPEGLAGIERSRA